MAITLPRKFVFSAIFGKVLLEIIDIIPIESRHMIIVNELICLLPAPRLGVPPWL